MDSSKVKTIISWILQLAVAGLMLWAGVPKLLGDEMAVNLFTDLPGGDLLRYTTGGLEVLAAIVILIPGFAHAGALLSALVMAGALGAHAVFLGFEGEMGTTAAVAGGILALDIIVFILNKDKCIFLNKE